MLRYAFTTTVLLSAALMANDALAAGKASKLKIGEVAPDWTALDGTDGKPHSLTDYKDAKALVIVFTCNRCPVAQAYQDRLVALQKDYAAKGAQVIAICVNKGAVNDLDAMKKRAEEANFNFPYLYDPSQRSGQEYGATCTPHVFVLDKDRKIAYTGAIDDNQHANKVTKNYVRDALDAVLDGKQPETATTQQFGCGIQYK